jgi:murein DD-endopeptidase MepM/ murein hydrolase activator NlpD
LIKQRRRAAGRRTGNALVPVFGKKALPQIYLQDTKAEVAAVFLPESGDSGVGARFKWLVSTCLAGFVGVGVIGVSVYASMNVDDGAGVVSSIRRASMAAMQPMQRTRAVREDQTVYGVKSDRIQETARGLATTQVIQDSVEQKVGGQSYIGIKRYGRLVATLGTAQPNAIDRIPPFNPFKLFSNPTPVGDAGDPEGGDAGTGSTVSVRLVDLDGGLLPADDNIELGRVQIARLIAETGQLLAEAPYAMRTAILPDGAENYGLSERNGLLQRAAYSPEQPPLAGMNDREATLNTTIVEKSWVEPEEEVYQNTEVRTVTVKRGDTLMGILTDAGAELWQAKDIVAAMAPMFLAKSLQKGQEVRMTLAPAPSDSGQMEPVSVSLFSSETHEVTVARDGSGEFIVSDEPIETAGTKHAKRLPKRATLYTSFYDAALNKDLPRDMIKRVLRIHSYDVDFKRKVHAGDGFEVFFDLDKEDSGREAEPGELLFTSMTVDGNARRFFRYRTPDGVVDYYDEDGNSAKKFLMRQPVKGSRFTSGFGMRRHPVHGRRRMHTGTDWAAPRGTPILAGGDGIVEQAGRKGGYGNYVLLRHANGFKTAYGHMARIAKGMRPGIHVSQGQVIGYVGSTGVSTGPHLHYEVLVNNRRVNPMTIHVPRGRQLTGKLLAKFQKERMRIEDLMRRRAVTTQVALATQDAR